MRSLIFAAIAAIGLTGCAGLDQGTFAFGQQVIDKGTAIEDKVIGGMATAFHEYCDKALGIVRTHVRDKVNAQLTVDGSRWRASDFCVSVAMPPGGGAVGN